MKNIPAWKEFINALLQSLKRFPMVCFSAFCAAATSILAIERVKFDSIDETRLIFLCFLGIPLFLGFTLLSENPHWRSPISGLREIKESTIKWIGRGLVALFLVFFYFYLPDESRVKDQVFVLYFQISAFAHLLVAVAPFIGQSQIADRFWIFNKSLFLRIFLSALYANVIYVGISVGILAISKLFEIKVSSNLYQELWVLIFVIFNTLFFMAGVPRLKTMPHQVEYHKGLRFFVQFTLIPISIFYLLILYAFMGKILFQWSLPKGWVSYLIIGFSLTSLLSYLLIFPIRLHRKFSLIFWYSKCLFWAFLPLLGLLGVAVYRRVSEYGITEPRYILVVGSLWLAGVTLYMLIGRKQSIDWIPKSLAGICLLITFGPLSSPSISYKSQIQRLENLLMEYQILKDGQVSKVVEAPDFKVQKEISSIIRYIFNKHSLDQLAEWTGKSKKEVKNLSYRKYVEDIIGIQYVNRWQSRNSQYIYLRTVQNVPFPVDGFKLMFPVNYYLGSSKKESELIKKVKQLDLELVFNVDTSIVTFRKISNPDHQHRLDMNTELKKANVSPLKQNADVPEDLKFYNFILGETNYRFVFNFINVTTKTSENSESDGESSTEFTLRDIGGYILKN